MVKFDHMALPVTDFIRSRDWYVGNLGFAVEFEDRERGMVAIKDDADFTIFLSSASSPLAGEKCALTIQVGDVDAKYRELAARGVPFQSAPQKLFWGYGAELRDPDGYLIMLWDERSMRDKGGR